MMGGGKARKLEEFGSDREKGLLRRNTLVGEEKKMCSERI